MSNNLEKDFQAFQQKVKDNLKRFPVLSASEAQNFFLDSFKKQAWFGETNEVWKRRKPTAKRNKGRALLVDTGRLKRSIRIKQASWSGVIIGSDVQYAGVHNEGFRGTYSRTASRKARFKSTIENWVMKKEAERQIIGRDGGMISKQQVQKKPVALTTIFKRNVRH